MDAVDAGTAKLGCRLVVVALGGRSCSATTDAAGAATCDASTLPPDPTQVTAAFAGDARYARANATAVAVVAAAPPSGTLVVGDGSASGHVTFWTRNGRRRTRSAAAAPASFK